MSGDLSAPQALHLFARWREACEARGAARAAGDHELARLHTARALTLGDLIHAIPSARLDILTDEVEALTRERELLQARWPTFCIKHVADPTCRACCGRGEIVSTYDGPQVPCMCVLGLPLALLNMTAVMPAKREET